MPQRDRVFQPFISVVVPVYNGKRTIQACIEALLVQDYPSHLYEIIVVDNNSTDGTDTIVKKYPVKLVYERETQTSYAARNKGISLATGEIIAFTDADCVAATDWLNQLAKPFNDATVGGVGGNIVDNLKMDTLIEQFVASLQPLQNCFRFEGKFLPVVITANAAYRADCLQRLGSFRSNLFTIADIDLAWRLQILLNADIIYAPNAIVHHMHRHTLKAMFFQQRRAGMGQILLTSMYGEEKDYPYPSHMQLKIVLKQTLSLLTYVRSAIYRSVVWLFNKNGKDTLYFAKPVLHFVAEVGALSGRIQGLWATRFFTRNLIEQLWEVLVNGKG